VQQRNALTLQKCSRLECVRDREKRRLSQGWGGEERREGLSSCLDPKKNITQGSLIGTPAYPTKASRPASVAGLASYADQRAPVTSPPSCHRYTHTQTHTHRHTHTHTHTQVNSPRALSPTAQQKFQDVRDLFDRSRGRRVEVRPRDDPGLSCSLPTSLSPSQPLSLLVPSLARSCTLSRSFVLARARSLSSLPPPCVFYISETSSLSLKT
jgi:hypothetical protein